MLKAGPILNFCTTVIFVTMISGEGRAIEDPVVAIVNGENIYRSSLLSAQKLLPQQYQKMPFDQIYPALIDSVIDLKLSAADAREKKLHESASFKSLMSRITDQMLQRTALQREIEKAVTKDALRKRYEEMVSKAEQSEEVRARHILVKTKEEASTIIKELEAGAGFEALAKKKSTGPSGPNGGELGFFGKGQMVPEFEEAAFGLDKGEVGNTPIKTQFGWHVIKVEDRRKAEPPSYASVEGKLEAEISQEASSEYVSSLRNAAKIKRFDLNGKPLIK